jgi:hypothetical protein
VSGRLVVFAVVLVAAIAAADSVRGRGAEPVPADETPARALRELHDAGGYTLAGRPKTRVLRDGRVYLTADQIAAAFPPPAEGVLFEIGHAAASSDGTLALAIYNFGTGRPPQNAIQLWRGGELVAAYAVPPGTFGGGIGFTGDGRLVARAPRGDEIRMFSPLG